MAPHSSTLAWKIPWTEEPGGLQFMGSLRVGHNWATSLSLFTFMHWRRKWQPTPCLENPRDGGAWWADVYGVAQSRTWLKWLSSSSSSRSHDLGFNIENKQFFDVNLLNVSCDWPHLLSLISDSSSSFINKFCVDLTCSSTFSLFDLGFFQC